MITAVISLILCALVGKLSLYYWNFFNEKKTAPPGPTPIPILGNLLEISKISSKSYLALAELTKRYGEIYKVRFGNEDTIVLSSLEAVKKVLNHENALGRDLSGVFLDRSLGKELGMAFVSGERWKVMRSWTVKNLKNFGFGNKDSTESVTKEELVFLTRILDSIAGTDGVLDAHLLFNLTPVNVVWKMMTGKRISEEDEKAQQFLKLQDETMKQGSVGVSLIFVFPFLRFIFPEKLGYKIIMRFYVGFIERTREILQQCKSQFDSIINPDPTNLLEAYISEMNVQKNNPTTLFTEENLAILYLDLFQGGSETTGALVEWIILFMALNPEKQSKLQAEIDTVLPKMLPCSMDHRDSMQYVQACILETHRHAKILPNGVPRKAAGDIGFKNFTIRKGAAIITDHHTINNNHATWGPDPQLFKPERFIGDQGGLINADKILPFSIGKRNCPGEQLATVVSFLMVVTLFQRYKFSVFLGKEKLSTEPADGFTMRPQPYKVLIQRRQC